MGTVEVIVGEVDDIEDDGDNVFFVVDGDKEGGNVVGVSKVPVGESVFGIEGETEGEFCVGRKE
eukprot:11613980-Ditylum_brightwellii.AAC.1